MRPKFDNSDFFHEIVNIDTLEKNNTVGAS